MLIRHLSYFITLAREKHFARTAEICHIGQPTLSAAIRNLEEELNVKLIHRSHRFLNLTAEGERLLIWAQRIVKDYSGLRDDLATIQKGLQGCLRLGVIPAAMPFVSVITSRFLTAHPSATVEIQSLTSRDIQRGLDTFELDAGLTYIDNEPLENVRKIPLYGESYIFATRREGRFATLKSISWAEAAEQKLCLLSDDMQNRRILNHIFQRTGLTVRPAVTSNSFLGICSHLQQKGWSSILPHTFSYLFGGIENIALINLTDPIHKQEIGLVISDTDPLLPMAAALIKLGLPEEIATVIKAARLTV